MLARTEGVFFTVIKLKFESSSRLAVERDIKLNKAVYISLSVSIYERQRPLTKTFGFLPTVERNLVV